MKLFLWPRYDDDSPVMFAMAETVEQARQLIRDEHDWVMKNAPNRGHASGDFLYGIGALNESVPEVFNAPSGFFIGV